LKPIKDSCSVSRLGGLPPAPKKEFKDLDSIAEKSEKIKKLITLKKPILKMSEPAVKKRRPSNLHNLTSIHKKH